MQRVNVKEFLELAKENPVFDVRSPAEYEHAHIPNAISLPIFSNEQRAEIGTAYKQQSVQDAIKIGLKHFGPNFLNYIAIVEKHIKSTSSKKVLVHCWRGGMRSGAMAWLLDFYGFDVVLLEGGYKAYRNYVLNHFALPYQFNVLGGNTGSAKTEVLKELTKLKETVVDLEGLAMHKGSAFGALGMGVQPSQEQFENNLAKELLNYIQIQPDGTLVQEKRIWVENESQRIGLVNIPKVLFETMAKSPLYILKVPFEHRLNFIIEHYGKFSIEELMAAVKRIERKLGGLETKNVLACLENKDIFNAFDLLLNYYDRQYLLASKRVERIGIQLDSDEIDFEKNAKSLLELAK